MINHVKPIKKNVSTVTTKQNITNGTPLRSNEFTAQKKKSVKQYLGNASNLLQKI